MVRQCVARSVQGVDVERFVAEAVRMHGARSLGPTTGWRQSAEWDPLREICVNREGFTARFEMPVTDGTIYLGRTYPVVEGLAAHMWTGRSTRWRMVSPNAPARSARGRESETTFLLLRFRYHIMTRRGSEEIPLLAEACQVAGFWGSPAAPAWLPAAEAEQLLDAQPDANVTPQQATQFISRNVGCHAAVGGNR